jgi:hypothetical protein
MSFLLGGDEHSFNSRLTGIQASLGGTLVKQTRDE